MKNNPIMHQFQTTSTTILANKKAGIDITFQNISYSVQIPDQSSPSFPPCSKKYLRKQILKNISGIFKAGQCTAIMGASGAGKTTLLNILACRIQPDDGGKLYANNLQYNYGSFGDFANYVMQTDVLMQTLTVRECLEFAARLKLNLQQTERKQRVVQIANQLKLEKCLDTLIGGVIVKGVSGGQKKRTSIAFQLISDPQVIFLDEPTSGLDSLTSYIIVSELKKLTRRDNKTVIMTIHQPNSQIYAIFDNLTLLLQGRIIYHQKACNAPSYFDKKFQLSCPQLVNPPDFIMSKIHYQDQSNRALYPKYFQAYEKTEQTRVLQEIMKKRTDDVPLREVAVGFCTALAALTHRNFLNVVRNPMLLKSKIIQGIFISLFVGGIFFGIGNNDYKNIFSWYSLTGFLFFMCISALMSALAPITLTFPLQRDVFFKQQDAKMYTTSSYFLARNLIQIPQIVLIPLITVSVYYFMVGLSATGQQFFTHWLIHCLLAFNGSSLGLLLGSAILDAKSVSAMVPIIVLPLFLFSGFFKNRKDLPDWIGWVQYVSPLKYGFNAFVDNQVAHKASYANLLHFDLDLWSAVAVLFGLGLAFRLLSLFCLWFFKKKSQ